MKVIKESGIGRLWQHTKDDDTFAIIGSQDKDTKEIRDKELFEYTRRVSERDKIGYNVLEGTFTYEDGSLGVEPSVIIYGISKGTALAIARRLNQESIVWKDNNYFGFLKPNGEEDGRFDNSPHNMSFSDVEKFGSRLAHHKNHNKGKKFAFKLESLKPSTNNSIRALSGYEEIREFLEEWRFN